MGNEIADLAAKKVHELNNPILLPQDPDCILKENKESSIQKLTTIMHESQIQISRNMHPKIHYQTHKTETSPKQNKEETALSVVV